MLYRFVADAVFLLHLLFILFAVLGAVLLPRYPRLVYLHLPALAWAVYIEVSGGICPLTPLENHYRALAGLAGYSGGFIEHYLLPIVYPPTLTYTLQYFLAGALALINVCFFWRWYRK